MSIEAIKTITEAEERARLSKAEATAAAKKMIAEAEEAGQKTVEAAKAKAFDELSELRTQAKDKARAEALKLAHGVENRKAAMLVKAEGRADKAIGLVVERIVNS